MVTSVHKGTEARRQKSTRPACHPHRRSREGRFSSTQHPEPPSALAMTRHGRAKPDHHSPEPTSTSQPSRSLPFCPTLCHALSLYSASHMVSGLDTGGLTCPRGRDEAATRQLSPAPTSGTMRSGPSHKSRSSETPGQKMTMLCRSSPVTLSKASPITW